MEPELEPEPEPEPELEPESFDPEPESFEPELELEDSDEVDDGDESPFFEPLDAPDAVDLDASRLSLR